MEKKETTRKAWGKILFGILFVISCFIAMYVLIHFYEQTVMVGGVAALLFISAFLFLNALFSEKEGLAALPEEEEDLFTGADGEFQLKIVKHMKEVEKNQKEMLEVLKNQSNMMQSKLGDVQHEVYLLSEKQISQTKSIIKYNKENARQLAISERETLEYVLQELKEKPAFETVTGDELLQVSDLVSDEEYIEPETMLSEAEPEPDMEGVEEPAMKPETETLNVEEPVAEISPDEVPVEELEIPELPDALDLSALFDIPELDEEAPAEKTEEVHAEADTEEMPAEAQEPAPAADPNAMMTPEEIAKLLASMGK